MNTKQVAEWLMEVVGLHNRAAESYNKAGWGGHATIQRESAKLWEERAAQVEAMTCDTCQHWHHIEAGDGECNSPKNSSGNYGFEEDWMRIDICGPKFCCPHHETKK